MSTRFLCRADILAAGAETWMSKDQNDSAQYFRRLKLEEVNPIPRPSCLPEEKGRKERPTELAAPEQGKPSHSVTSGGHTSLTSPRRRSRKDEVFEVTIPLSNERLKVGDLRESMKTEYAARYLEKLGASPSPANVSLILKHMPIEGCKIHQIFHPGMSQTERKNFISIRPMAQQGSKKGATSNLPTNLQELHPFPVERLPEPSVQQSAEQLAATEAEDKEKDSLPIASFEECKERFIYPFNLPPRWTMPDMDVVEPRHTEPTIQEPATITASKGSSKGKLRALSLQRERAHILSSEEILSAQRKPSARSDGTQQTRPHRLSRVPHPRGSASGAPSRQTTMQLTPAVSTLFDLPREPKRRGPAPPLALSHTSSFVGCLGSPEGLESKAILGGAGGPLSYAASEAMQMAKEVAMPVQIALSDVQEILRSFVELFPFDTLKEGLAADAIKVELCSQRFAEFLKATGEFMYWTFISPLASITCHTKDRDEKFLVVYSAMLALVEQKKKQRQHVSEMPIILLTLRAGLDALMKYLYPTWTATEGGSTTLAQMDCLLMLLLDPMDFLSRLPHFEAAPEALRVLHQRRVPSRMPASYTSPIVRFLISQASSREARAFMSGRRVGSAYEKDRSSGLQFLSPDLRANILQLFAQHKLGLAKQA
eukprot:GGOE01024915.1.p1 GENE.GGOE01024915.1~~GGOE01024915.1.p1  ORF type:complete len:655 (-),score=177.21 GGOE01024915.1:279-2243(-)